MDRIYRINRIRAGARDQIADFDVEDTSYVTGCFFLNPVNPVNPVYSCFLV
jgi:hypothetical protein